MSIPIPYGVSARRLRRAKRLACAVAGFVCLAAPLRAADPPPHPLQAQVEALLKQEKLAPEHVGLLIFSTAQRRYLAAVNADQPRIAASNTKLVTAFTALRVLGPNYRWRTRLSLVEQNDVPGAAPRQGLLIEGSGDPTITPRVLEAIALRLKSEGVRRLDGPIYLDASLFAEEPNPNPLPPESPGYVPLSPFIVDGNALEFTVTRSKGGAPEALTAPLPDGVRVRSLVQDATEGRSAIRIEQAWGDSGGTFTLSGVVTRLPRQHAVSTYVSQPSLWFYTWLRQALRRVGIEGDPPLRMAAVPDDAATRFLFTWLSPPLREAVVEIEKNSNNLGAEVMLRALGQTAKPKAIGAKDGLAVLRRSVAKEFPGAEGQVRLFDGSGLSRNNQVSPQFLVRLLNRVLHEADFRSEFQSALPVVGWDGTLRYRGATPDLEGHLRAKTGTLIGVSNLSGYLTTPDDLLVFSFLINDSTQPVEALQAAQDQVIAGIYSALVPGEAKAAVAAAPEAPPAVPDPPKVEKAAPAALKPEPTAPEPRILPPPPSPKPKRSAP